MCRLQAERPTQIFKVKKYLLLISVFACINFHCNTKTSSGPDAIDKFWSWFKANQTRLSNYQQDPDKIIGEVVDSAQNIQDGLAIEFQPPENNIIKVTISADGDRNLFPIVEEIISRAPKLEGWQFFAFRQRIPISKLNQIVIKAEGPELDPTKMKFLPIQKGDSLDIIVYTEKLNENNFNQIAYSGLMLIDNILGEYDCVTKINKYDFQTFPTNKSELNELRPLVDLATFVDSFYKTKREKP